MQSQQRPSYFRWNPSRHTLIAGVAGVLAVALSLALVPLASWQVLSAVVRDLCQIFLVGVMLPLLYVRRSGEPIAGFGLHLRKCGMFLAINLVLALGLLFQFKRASPLPQGFQWDTPTLWKAAYVGLALVFELLFFYAFLRTLFERAFGVVPSIALVALFYSFHHAGFQPEFVKLFFVGVLYATVYRLGNSALLIFPFFLGVGGIYDVLVQSRVVAPIVFVEVRTLALLALLSSAFFWYWRSTRRLSDEDAA